MSKRAIFFIGSLGVLVVLAVAAFLFFRFQVKKSFPQTSGVIILQDVADSVTITRDGFGVPTIRARSERDAYVALGYVHAQDRLWEMDINRRIGQGRLAEVLGDTTVQFDRMFRILGLRAIAGAIERSLSPASRDILSWYTEGVNAFIQGNRGRYPVEFDLLRYDPEPWTPLHSLIVARLIAWELNLSWWTDLTYGAIAERVGLERALDIFPSYPPEVAPMVHSSRAKGTAEAAREFMKVAQRFVAFSGGAPTLAGGSNAWAVSPARSATGSVLLANDTHLRLELPSKWYEAEIEAPGLHVRGMTVPGMPAVIAGRNDRIAWGITNVMADDADFYVEQIDSADASRYLSSSGTFLPFDQHEELIAVRGGATVPLTVRRTVHGPVVTDIRTVLQRGVPPYVASMRWTGMETDDPLAAFTKINRAGTWEEFSRGLREFTVPGQNFIYGDVDGNIGYRCGVRLPVRGKSGSLLPLPGWEKDSEWKGFVPFDQLPSLFNPPEGYIASANNKLTDDSYPYHISDLWEPPARIMRLRGILGGVQQNFSVTDFERLQRDTYSSYAKQIVSYIFGAFADSTLGLPEGTSVFEYLRNWNYMFEPEDIATSIFQQFFVTMIRAIYADEMGEDLFHDFVILGNVPLRVTARLMQDGTSPWFDDIRTDSVETRDDIIRASLRDAVLELRQRFGLEMKTWRWGTMHTVTLQHPFGLQKPLDRIFNIGPYPYPGGSTAMLSGEYSLNEPFGVMIAASYRQIFDLSSSGTIRSVLPSGQSGQVFHPYYGDQTELWLNSMYKSARWGELPLHREQLTLAPQR